MIQIRKSDDRGYSKLDWLESRFSFSFADYIDPNNKGFSVLRVINQDIIDEGKGFSTHPHHDMEIITYVLEGEIAHKDSMGNGSVIKPGEIQKMSAGTGITHSEFNPSNTNKTELLQIWIKPNLKGIEPNYQQKTVPIEAKTNKLCLIASPSDSAHSVAIQQDAFLYASVLEGNKLLEYDLAEGRCAWLQVVKGNLSINSELVCAGDGVAITNEAKLKINSQKDGSEFLLFDLPEQN